MGILENEGIPYTFNYDLKAGTSSQRSGRPVTKAEERMMADRARKLEGLPLERYDPYADNASGVTINALQASNPKTGQVFTAQPKMYGGAITALDESNYDWANNGLGAKPK